MNNKLKAIIIAFIILIIILVLLTFYIQKEGNKEYYKLGNDKIISITNVVGRKKVKSINTKKYKNSITKKYKYINIKNTKSDINSYVKELIKNDYINTTPYNLNKNNGKIKFAKKSIDKDNIIIITIIYNKNCYEIIIEKGIGTIQLYN